jgi:uncharacterized protein YbaA (DUF1428 family)
VARLDKSQSADIFLNVRKTALVAYLGYFIKSCLREKTMAYIEGFVIPVPRAKADAYREQARRAAPIFRDLGATRIVETWGSDIPDGKVTDFKRAVQATADEDIVFSWIEYPDKATRDLANEKMMSDPRFEALGEMAFDGKRMIFAGFDVFLDTDKA